MRIFGFEEFADRVACLVEEHVDIDRLLAITALPERQPVPRVKEVMRTVSKANLNIAIARDPLLISHMRKIYISYLL